MTQIDSTLTRPELEAIMRDNSGWMFDASLVKVQLFIQACQSLLSLPLSEYDHAGERARVEIRVIQEDRDRAMRWYNTRRMRAVRGRVTYPDMTNFREHG